MDLYPFEEDKTPYGIAVQNYIVKYLDKLIEGVIPYENIDRRIFRLVWEHKKAMFERIETIEKMLELDSVLSDEYINIVKMADNMRMLYASYRIKKRDGLLPLIKNELIKLIEAEKMILTKFVDAVGEKIEE